MLQKGDNHDNKNHQEHLTNAFIGFLSIRLVLKMEKVFQFFKPKYFGIIFTSV